jgi:hypothetical protein
VDGGEWSRTHESRVWLGGFSPEEIQSVANFLVVHYVSCFLDDWETHREEIVEKITRDIPDKWPRPALSTMAKRLIGDYKAVIDEKIKQTGQYQMKTKDAFLIKARSLAEKKLGRTFLEEQYLSDEQDKDYGHYFDHIADFRSYRGIMRVYGESTTSPVGAQVYQSRFRELARSIRKRADQALIVIAPKFTSNASQEISDDDAYYEVVMEDGTVNDGRNPPGIDPEKIIIPEDIIPRLPSGKTPGGKPKKIQIRSLLSTLLKTFPDLTEAKLIESINKDGRMKCSGKSCWLV